MKINALLSVSIGLSGLATIFSIASIGIALGYLESENASLAGFDALARNYILDHPDVIIEAIQRLDESNKLAETNEITVAIRDNSTELFNSQSSPWIGNPNADVTLVEFFDYNCPYCRKAVPTISNAVDSDNLIRVVFKEWPILGPGSEFAARAALASHMQGKYEAFHQALMKSPGSVDESTTLDVAAKVGLDIDRLRRDMNAAEIKAELERNFALAEKLRITGTPTFIVGEEIIRGLVERLALQQAITNARKIEGD